LPARSISVRAGSASSTHRHLAPLPRSADLQPVLGVPQPDIEALIAKPRPRSPPPDGVADLRRVRGLPAGGRAAPMARPPSALRSRRAAHRDCHRTRP
jgi:hypothetical protein